MFLTIIKRLALAVFIVPCAAFFGKLLLFDQHGRTDSLMCAVLGSTLCEPAENLLLGAGCIWLFYYTVSGGLEN